jgi:hypothetical protein
MPGLEPDATGAVHPVTGFDCAGGEQSGRSSLMALERTGDVAPVPLREVAVDQFIHRQNLELYRMLLADPNLKDEIRRRTISRLLADEEAKDLQPPGKM